MKPDDTKEVPGGSENSSHLQALSMFYDQSSHPGKLAAAIDAMTQFLLETRPRREPSDATRRNYLRTYLSRKRRQLLDPNLTATGDPPAKRSVAFNRAALRYGIRSMVEDWLFALNGGLTDSDSIDLETDALRILETMALCQRFAPSGERIDEAASKSRFSPSKAEPKQVMSTFKPATSKRQGIAKLGLLWRKRFWLEVSPWNKYRDETAITIVTGLRPKELSAGVRVERISESTLAITIEGAKTSDTTGLSSRVLHLDLKAMQADPDFSGPVAHLAACVNEVGSVRVWSCKAKAIYAAIAATGRKAFPGNAYRVSPYSFRHQMGSDMRTATGERSDDRVEAAAVMSHASTRSITTYGSRSTTKRRVSPGIKAASVVGSIRVTHSPPPEWPPVRSKSARAAKAKRGTKSGRAD